MFVGFEGVQSTALVTGCDRDKCATCSSSSHLHPLHVGAHFLLSPCSNDTL